MKAKQFNIGDSISLGDYGIGTVKKIITSYGNKHYISKMANEDTYFEMGVCGNDVRGCAISRDQANKYLCEV